VEWLLLIGLALLWWRIGRIESGIARELDALTQWMVESGLLRQGRDNDPNYETPKERKEAAARRNSPEAQAEREARQACEEARGARPAQRSADGTIVKAVPPLDRVEGHSCPHCPAFEAEETEGSGPDT